MALRISKQMPSEWPLITAAWPLNPAMHYTLVWVFWLPNLVATGHLKVLDLWFTPTWPLHDLWPQQWVTRWSGVLSTKFGGHTAFLSHLTSGWPQLTPAWHLTPAMHYALVRGSSHQMWWPQGIAKQIDSYLTPVDPYTTLTPAMHYAMVRGSSHQSWWP